MSRTKSGDNNNPTATNREQEAALQFMQQLAAAGAPANKRERSTSGSSKSATAAAPQHDSNPSSSFATQDLLQQHLFRTSDSTDRLLADMMMKSSSTSTENDNRTGNPANNPAGAAAAAAAGASRDTSIGTIQCDYTMMPTTSTTFDPSIFKSTQSSGMMNNIDPSVFKSTQSAADVFSSNTWATSLQPSHVDVDYQNIFPSSAAQIPPGRRLTRSLSRSASSSGNNKKPPPAVAAVAAMVHSSDSKADSNTLLQNNHHLPTAGYPTKAAAAAATATAIALENMKKHPEQPVVQQKAAVARTTAAATAASKTQKPPRKRKRKPKPEPVKNFITDSITDADVLMGRGGRTNHHVGNATYLKEKLKIQTRYMAAAKEDKTAISQELVDAIHNLGGRFLKLDDSTQKWYEVDNTTARKKASQTLREINTAESRAAKRAKYSKK